MIGGSYNNQHEMKLVLVLCLVAVAVAAPPRGRSYYSDPSSVQLVRYNYDNIGLGPYSFSFEQSDGQKRQEQAELRNEGRDDEYLVVKGSYSWVAPNGVRYTITYIADDNGYQPEIEEGPGLVVSDDLAATLIG